MGVPEEDEVLDEDEDEVSLASDPVASKRDKREADNRFFASQYLLRLRRSMGRGSVSAS